MQHEGRKRAGEAPGVARSHMRPFGETVALQLRIVPEVHARGSGFGQKRIPCQRTREPTGLAEIDRTRRGKADEGNVTATGADLRYVRCNLRGHLIHNIRETRIRS